MILYAITFDDGFIVQELGESVDDVLHFCERIYTNEHGAVSLISLVH